MGKREVIVDTCFLQKLSADGKKIENFRMVLDELNFTPVVHPYDADNELDMFPYFHQLCDEGYIRTIDYKEFLTSDVERHLYESAFLDVYNELSKMIDSQGGRKQLPKLTLKCGESVFNLKRSGISLGDVHMVLMADYMKLPIILTMDSDIDLLRSIAKRKFGFDSYCLDIYDIVDLLIQIAENQDRTMDKKMMEAILKESGLMKRRGEVFSHIRS